jgi:serine/threonine protein phosphatase PrpC
MRTVTALRAAGLTDPGLKRDVNEDRFHVDLARGLFMVVDGVGGQAAGGKAADIALSMLRTRLERETGPTVERVREAITIANNEIYRLAATRPEWHGMACVLTVAVVEDGRAVVGHVGDSRLYKVTDRGIEKITRDHSPVGEREDAHEISEFEAMHHPRRNEVYRDVGAEPHEPADPDFIDLIEMPFDPNEALLICSDGLTDVVDSATITDVLQRYGGEPEQVVRALVDKANDAGGKDNITVVYVEGEQFTPARPTVAVREPAPTPAIQHHAPQPRRAVRIALVVLLTAATGFAIYQWRSSWLPLVRGRIAPLVSNATVLVVQSTDSLAAILDGAGAGSTVLVEPGEYRERLVLRSGVRVVSRVPRGATIRLPGTASETDPAVVADGIAGAEFTGFRIVGDAATPLGTGLLLRNSDVSVVDLEVSGAVTAAIDVDDTSGTARATVMASDIHDNPGAALAIRGGASPRIAHNVFLRNALSQRAQAVVTIEHWEQGAEPQFTGNVFHGITSKVFGALSDEVRAAIVRDNFFPDDHDPRSAAPPPARGRQSR